MSINMFSLITKQIFKNINNIHSYRTNTLLPIIPNKFYTYTFHNFSLIKPRFTDLYANMENEHPNPTMNTPTSKNTSTEATTTNQNNKTNGETENSANNHTNNKTNGETENSANNHTNNKTNGETENSANKLSPDTNNTHKPAPFDASKTIFKPNPNPTKPYAIEDIRFGYQFTDYMCNVDWDEETGWSAPVIEPMGMVTMHPGASGLHYGLQMFEGMKAYKGKDGKCYLFRPDKNMARFNNSARRLDLPTVDENEMVKLIMKTVDADRHHIPQSNTPGYSLYIRPFMYSTHPYIGLSTPKKARVSIIMCPAATYFGTSDKPLKVLAHTTYSRSYPGSAGDAKVGGNYAPTYQPMAKAAKDGFSQILWLHKTDDDFVVTEAGTMNMFFVWKTEDGKTELVTPKLENNLILPGITRESILELAQNYEDIDTAKECTINMEGDLIKAFNEGRMCEMFGAGTAAIVTPIHQIEFEGKTYSTPFYTHTGGSGPISTKLKNHIMSIQYGETPHPWAVPF